jgi:hypothetical protein
MQGRQSSQMDERAFVNVQAQNLVGDSLSRQINGRRVR